MDRSFCFWAHANALAAAERTNHGGWRRLAQNFAEYWAEQYHVDSQHAQRMLEMYGGEYYTPQRLVMEYWAAKG